MRRQARRFELNPKHTLCHAMVESGQPQGKQPIGATWIACSPARAPERIGLVSGIARELPKHLGSARFKARSDGLI